MQSHKGIPDPSDYRNAGPKNCKPASIDSCTQAFQGKDLFHIRSLSTSHHRLYPNSQNSFFLISLLFIKAIHFCIHVSRDKYHFFFFFERESHLFLLFRPKNPEKRYVYENGEKTIMTDWWPKISKRCKN